MTRGAKPLASTTCRQCEDEFTPKLGGYNARYCRDTCKRRNQRARLLATNPNQLTVARSRSYRHTKAHPARLEKHRATCRETRRKVYNWLAAYKLKRGCVDCGYRKHSAALQLDHEGPKSVEISEARSSIRRLKAEIEAGQCKVRCANCHSIRTWERKQPAKSVSE